MTFAYRPVVYAASVAFSGAMVLVSWVALLVAPSAAQAGRVAAVDLFLVAVSLPTARWVARSWATFEVRPEGLFFRRPFGRRMVIAREALSSVSVDRSRGSWPTPVTYSVELPDGRRMTFAEHWLSGGRAERRAREVAQVLGLPVRDPDGERWRESPWRAWRWLGRGEEWKVLALVIGVALGLLATLAVASVVALPRADAG